MRTVLTLKSVIHTWVEILVELACCLLVTFWGVVPILVSWGVLAAMSSPSAHRHRRVAYPREMVNPVDDVIDSGVSRRSGGRRHLFNPELMRDGMWRELEPLIAFNVCTAAANEGQYGEMLKVQEQHVDLGDGEEGSIVRISVRLPGKCLIESLNIYSAVPVNLRLSLIHI